MLCNIEFPHITSLCTHVSCDCTLGAKSRTRVWWRYQPNFTTDPDTAG